MHAIQGNSEKCFPNEIKQIKLVLPCEMPSTDFTEICQYQKRIHNCQINLSTLNIKIVLHFKCVQSTDY